MLLLSSLQFKKTFAIASSAMKTRLSIDTDFETYRAIIARTKTCIPDDDFIVHRGDIYNPDYKAINRFFLAFFTIDWASSC
jgi:hypothetical protein